MKQINGARAPAKASRGALRVRMQAVAEAPPKPKTEKATPAELGYTMPGLISTILADFAAIRTGLPSACCFQTAYG